MIYTPQKSEQNRAACSPGNTERPLTLLEERFLSLGLNCLEEKEIIELIISNGHPCCMNKIKPSASICQECQQQREAVIEKLKTVKLDELLSASPEELHNMGINWQDVVRLKLIEVLPAIVLKRKIIKKPYYQSSKEILDYLYYSMHNLKKEIFKAIYLDNANHIVDTVTLFEGRRWNISISPRDIIEDAVLRGSASVVFTHNHPSGDPAPSSDDMQLTRNLVFVGKIIQINVLDHIIIGDNTYFSFADEGLIKNYELDFVNFKIRRPYDGKNKKRNYQHYVT